MKEKERKSEREKIGRETRKEERKGERKEGGRERSIYDEVCKLQG